MPRCGFVWFGWALPCPSGDPRSAWASCSCAAPTAGWQPSTPLVRTITVSCVNASVRLLGPLLCACLVLFTLSYFEIIFHAFINSLFLSDLSRKDFLHVIVGFLVLF